MNIKEIVEEYLKQNSFDGLWHDAGCACKINDLMPCGDILPDCEPGHLLPCSPECGEHDWHIGQMKRADKERT